MPVPIGIDVPVGPITICSVEISNLRDSKIFLIYADLLFGSIGRELSGRLRTSTDRWHISMNRHRLEVGVL